MLERHLALWVSNANTVCGATVPLRGMNFGRNAGAEREAKACL